MQDLVDEDPELLDDRPVQAELLADLRDLLGRGVQAGEDLGRIAAEALEQREHQQHDAGQRRHHLPEAAQQVGAHQRRSPSTNTASSPGANATQSSLQVSGSVTMTATRSCGVVCSAKSTVRSASCSCAAGKGWRRST